MCIIHSPSLGNALHKKQPQLLGQNSVQQCLLVKRKLEVRVKIFLLNLILARVWLP